MSAAVEGAGCKSSTKEDEETAAESVWLEVKEGEC